MEVFPESVTVANAISRLNRGVVVWVHTFPSLSQELPRSVAHDGGGLPALTVAPEL